MIRIRTPREGSTHYQRLSDLTNRLTMTLIDSNKHSTKVLYKLKVKLSLWLTNPSQLTRRITREDSVKHHSTQEDKATADCHTKKKHTSNKHKQSQDTDRCINQLMLYPTNQTDQQCMHNSNWSTMLLLTNSTMHELNLLTYANHQTTLIWNSSKSVNTIDSTNQKLIQGEEEPK